MKMGTCSVPTMDGPLMDVGLVLGYLRHCQRGQKLELSNLRERVL